MKTIKFLLILVVSFIFMGNVNAQTNLAAWHFDVLAAAPNTPKIIQADYGLQSNSATIYLDGYSWIIRLDFFYNKPRINFF